MSDTPAPDDPSAVPDRRQLFKLGAGAAAGAGIIALGTASPAAAQISAGTYFSVQPARILDTRVTGGPISSGQTRTSTALTGSSYVCVCNLTVVNTAGSGGFLSVYSADLTTRPNPYSSINWQGAGKVVANVAIFDTGDAGFKVYCGGGGSTNYIIDFVGYFVTSQAARTAEQKAFENRAKGAAQRLASG